MRSKMYDRSPAFLWSFLPCLGRGYGNRTSVTGSGRARTLTRCSPVLTGPVIGSAIIRGSTGPARVVALFVIFAKVRGVFGTQKL